MASTGRRHPLLIYRRLFGAWRAPSLLIAVMLGGLWWWPPPALSSLLAQGALLGGAVTALLLFVYTLVAPRMAYVQCGPTALRVSVPLFRLAISYSRIRTTRPLEFRPNARGSRLWLAEPYLGRTVVAVDLMSYPIAPRWLRLWLNEFILPGDFMGLVLVTPDWMTLSRDIDTHRSEWKGRRAGPRKAETVPSLLQNRR
jgi:hypothetical protein